MHWDTKKTWMTRFTVVVWNLADHQTTVSSEVLPVMTSICTCHGIFFAIRGTISWFSHFKTSLPHFWDSFLCKMGICFAIQWFEHASQRRGPSPTPATVRPCPLHHGPLWNATLQYGCLCCACANHPVSRSYPAASARDTEPVPLTTGSLIEIGVSRWATERRDSGSRDAKRSGSDVDLPPTIRPLQNLENCSLPAARLPAIQSEMSHRQGRASSQMLGAEWDGREGRRDLGVRSVVWGVPGSNREVTRSLSAFLSLHLFSVTLGGLCHEPMSFSYLQYENVTYFRRPVAVISVILTGTWRRLVNRSHPESLSAQIISI